jgi:hypothetical protein
VIDDNDDAADNAANDDDAADDYDNDHGDGGEADVGGETGGWWRWCGCCR